LVSCTIRISPLTAVVEHRHRIKIAVITVAAFTISVRMLTNQF